MRSYGMRFSCTMICLIGMLLLASCDSKSPATVSGSVIVDGIPLDYGAITFVPVNEQGSSFGSVVSKGEYSSRGTPGSFRVVIVAGLKHEGDQVASSGDGRKLAEAGGVSQTLSQVPRDAVGNNTTVQISDGDNRHDFTITTK